MNQQILTKAEFKGALEKAAAVFVQPRFGISEQWLKISKKEAWNLYYALPSDDDHPVTPSDFDMPSDSFGFYGEYGAIYLG